MKLIDLLKVIQSIFSKASGLGSELYLRKEELLLLHVCFLNGRGDMIFNCLSRHNKENRILLGGFFFL